jgi:hypothetical protein
MKAFLVAAALLGCASLALAQTARVATSYNVVLRTGDKSMLTKEGFTFGTQYDKDMKALTSGGEPMMAHTTDFTSILKVRCPRCQLSRVTCQTHSLAATRMPY